MNDIHHHVVEVARRACASLAGELRVISHVGTVASRSENPPGLLELFSELFVAAIACKPLDPSVLARTTACTATVPLRQVFDIVRLAERRTESELAVESGFGQSSEQWHQAREMLRRASFELLASYCERRSPAVQSEGVDPATLIVSRPVLELAMENELHRALRHHRPLSLILFEVDDVEALREAHGTGVSDLLLERVGIFIRQYFRQQDWVARFSSSQVAVLLPETRTGDAEALATRASAAIRERMVFPDRDDRPVHITVSGCVLSVTLAGARDEAVSKVTASQAIEEAENTIRRVRAKGGNSIEQVEIARPSLSLADAAKVLRSEPDVVLKLIAARTLPSVEADGETRVDRLALEAYARRMQKFGRG